ncbi:RNA ligase partner protein [Candidatus Micrarchaeota archaeon]|nr:RNA ligase partner protein [Candidatus Micrarchaeota archaeon]
MARKFVLDTCLFVNPYSRKKFGESPTDAIKGFIKVIKRKRYEFYVPPSIMKELFFFAEKGVEELELVVKVRSPDVYSLTVPAAIFYDFIHDIRGRVNKGLRLAEQYAKDNRPDNDEKLKKLREKYRASLREGILDSTEDFDVLMLAKELKATIITSDTGIINLANKLGCKYMDATRFWSFLTKK